MVSNPRSYCAFSVSIVMRQSLRLSCSAMAMRVAIASAGALLAAGCSSDMTRLGEARSDLTPTASIPNVPKTPLMRGGAVNGVEAAGAGTYASQAAGTALGRASPISSTPLAPLPTRAMAPAAVAAPLAARAVSTPRPSYSAPATPSPQASLRPATQAPVSTGSITKPQQVSGWTAVGGTPIVVAQGETAAMLGARYGVPADTLLRTNGFSSASQVQPGARLVVPVYTGARSAAAQPKQSAPVQKAEAPVKTAKPVKQAAAAGPKEKLQFVKGAEPAAAKTAGVKTAPAKPAKIAAAKPEKAAAPVQTVEAKKPAKTFATTKAVETTKSSETAKAEAKPAKQQVAEGKAAKKPAAEKAAPAIDRETTTSSVDPAASTAAVAADDKPEFRWPARGRVIQSFKTGANDGINIALPEGTAIKAAEGGTVAYAGSELKGYGNMVLIRHPNGYVSAYANNGDLSVKRGDKVARGQTIAKSGQTGNVSSPQLHFELRKGSTPVDPTGYLAGL